MVALGTHPPYASRAHRARTVPATPPVIENGSTVRHTHACTVPPLSWSHTGVAPIRYLRGGLTLPYKEDNRRSGDLAYYQFLERRGFGAAEGTL